MRDDKINQTVNHLFRNESGKMVSVLVKIFGSDHLQLAEDVVQDALIAALENWKYKGIPENPESWLYRVARNKAIDLIRRAKHSQTFDFSDPEHQLLTSEYTLVKTMDTFWTEKHIRDDFLGMMYACCHPEISRESQVTFILKTLCGFSIKEIARAFLSNEETISKRIYRTKEYFRKNKLRPHIPREQDIPSKTAAVLEAVYLMFNEGYNSTHTRELIREDIMEQALFLCRSLTENPLTRLPQVYALMALICFHAARSSSRINEQGELITLAEQDRSKWDQRLIQAAKNYLNQSAFGNTISTFHFEAAIACEHCMAKNYSDTNWNAILEYYDMLIALNADPVVLLNRCIVIMELKGPQQALHELRKIDEGAKILQNYYLYHALLAELHSRLGNNNEARRNLLLARELTQSPQEKSLISARLGALDLSKN